MEEFDKVYAGLNQAQKKAVDTIDGPLLVVAGPGTGKTQLLSARVAQILRKTDALAQNILCLTFTESGAQNMRERLTRFIGADAYDVQISTYHAFGGDLIRRFPEYFSETRLERNVDELGKRQILVNIVDKLNYRDPLKQTRWHIGDLITTISEVKRGLLLPDELRAIAKSNLQIIQTNSAVIAETLRPYVKRLPSKLTVSEQLFQIIHGALSDAAKNSQSHPPFKNLAELAADELTQALVEASTAGKSTPLTKWKTKWLAKDDSNDYVLNGRLEAERILSLANVLETYEQALASRGLYDFDDMILRAIAALAASNELRYTLQEQYQYILLDEFQDTNAAQLRLVELLTDNPAADGRPNVLAVGDDDQAIYAFQGAQYSNMLDYAKLYRDVVLVNLSENYRSTPQILQFARAVADQINDSLVHVLPELEKQLVAAETHTTKTRLQHREYSSDVAERAGVAQQIAALVAAGIKPSQIAVLSPKHKYLEPLVPYLQDHKLAVSYERRENILVAPAIRQLLIMSQLVLALHDRDQAQADSLWPEVLSYDFWGHSVADIWQLSWQANDEHEAWAKLLLANKTFRPCALLILALAGQAIAEPLETVLDRLIGTEDVQTGDPDDPIVRSPFRQYYAGPSVEPDSLYRAVTELAVLRARLRDHEQQRGEELSLADLLNFAAQYEDAEQQLLNTSPYNQAAEAVQLMTIYKAKGLEFEHVFILHTQDNVWGGSASNAGNKLTLPANLAPIRHAGTSEDERLRIFFVALTRAKYGLHLSSFRANYAGKQMARLKYLHEIETGTGEVISEILPTPDNVVVTDNRQAPPLSAMEHDWRARHLHLDISLRSLLQERLQRYRLSPTHLTNFLDLEHAGPQAFLLQTLLRFPSAPSVDASFGNAMHATLEWVQQQVNTDGKIPDKAITKRRFSEFLSRQQMYGERFALQEARGHEALQTFLSEYDFRPENRPEYNFYNEGVVINGLAHMSGKIDLLEIDKQAKRITIVDYKTGSLGTSTGKLYRYELQLYCYKLLVEGSHTFAGYAADTAKLVFVEPDTNTGKLITKKIIFEDAKLEHVRNLLLAMWRRVQTLDLPDVSGYGTSLAAIKKFETDLLTDK